MRDSSRTQGTAICVGVGILGLWFLVGLLRQSYWAIALPVAVLVAFVLGLTFWVGYTIATIQVEPFEHDEPSAPAPTPPPMTQSAPAVEAAPAAEGEAPSNGPV